MPYTNIFGHRSMVFDSYRNKAYCRALEKVVSPSTTLMDLGAGLGVHGFNAARLGAARVLLVEPEPVIEIARKIAADNGLENVHCLASRVEDLELDEQLDVIVSVFTGNFLLTEDLLPSLFYARDKYLAPGGRLIPDRARMEVVPVSAPEYYRKHIHSWSESARFFAEHELPIVDYDQVRSFAANALYFDSADIFATQQLALPVPLMEIDFNTATEAACDSEIEVKVCHDGVCHGWLGWFQMHLVDEWLSTGSAAQPTHWRQVFLPLENPITLKTGESLRFALKRPEFGEWTWTTGYGEQSQRLSTFLSQPLSQSRMHKASMNYQPELSEHGRAAKWLLTHMSGELSMEELTEQVVQQYPTLFASKAEALKFTRALASKYS